MRTITAKDAKQIEGERGKEAKDDLRLAFDLRFVRKQYSEIQSINTSKMADNTFINTTFDELKDFIVGNV